MRIDRLQESVAVTRTKLIPPPHRYDSAVASPPRWCACDCVKPPCMPRRRYATFVLLLLLALCIPRHMGFAQSFASPPGAKLLSPEAAKLFLADAARRMDRINTVQVDFIQEHRVAAFMDTLTAKGTCYFATPDRIRWEVREPYRSALVFNRGRIAKFVYEQDRAKKLRTGAGVAMKQVLEMITLYLRGDFDSLTDTFEIEVEQRTTHVVRMTPKSKAMRDAVAAIELTMDEDASRIKTVTIREGRGDQIVIMFLREKRNVELSPKLFNLE